MAQRPNRRATLIACLLVLVFSLVALRFMSRPRGDAAVVMTKEHYLEGEPLEAELRLVNIHSFAIKARVIYPSAGSSRLFGFEAVPKGPEIAIRPLAVAGPARIIVAFSGIELQPGETKIIKFYLQRFINQPKPGDYRLPYKMEIEYDSADEPTFFRSRRGDSLLGRLDDYLGFRSPWDQTLRGSGVLTFTIKPSTPQELEPILSEYRRQGHTTEAAEALSSIQE